MSQNSINCKIYESSQELVNYFVNQFGLPSEIFNNKQFYQVEGSSIIYMSENEIPDLRNITQPGLPIFKGDFPKGYVTNAFIYRYGLVATLNVIEVKEENFIPLLNREGVDYEPNNPTFGPQIIKLKNKILGRGWTRDGLLFMDASKIWRQNLT